MVPSDSNSKMKAKVLYGAFSGKIPTEESEGNDFELVQISREELIEERIEPDGVYILRRETRWQYLVEPESIQRILEDSPLYGVEDDARQVVLGGYASLPLGVPSTRRIVHTHADVRAFNNCVETWRNSTRHFSFVADIVSHPAYLRIIGMGPAVLPLLLRELSDGPAHWFVALKAISGVDPVPVSACGNVKEMTNAWLEWGRKHSYIS